MNVIITGASEGIGKAIAEKFAKHQYNLFLIARNYERLLFFQKELSHQYKNIKVEIFPVDLSIKKNIPLVAESLLSKLESIDILINNAGQFIPTNILEEDDSALEKMLAINLYSAYCLSKALLPKMIAQQTGHIFNMCSIASLQAYPNSGAYSISKYALLGFSKNLREALKDKGVKVTTVFPGATMTKSWDKSNVANNRIMEANDIASMVFAAAQLSQQAVVEDIILRPQLGDL